MKFTFLKTLTEGLSNFKGAKGDAATIAIGTVTTGAPGSNAQVTNSGTANTVVLNFVLPRGDAGPSTIAAPTSRTTALATAYQATNPAKPAKVTVNLTSTANLSLSGGATNSADIVIGPTSAVASGTGTVIAKYSNSSTGTLTIGLNTNAGAANPMVFDLPANYYWAVRTTSGTVSIVSAFDQQLG